MQLKGFFEYAVYTQHTHRMRIDWVDISYLPNLCKFLQLLYSNTEYLAWFFVEGIHEQTDIGFLPTPDVAMELQLGSYLKNPPYPVWVINRAAHYSVVCCEDAGLLQDKPGIYTLCYLRLSGRSALLKVNDNNWISIWKQIRIEIRNQNIFRGQRKFAG